MVGVAVEERENGGVEEGVGRDVVEMLVVVELHALGDPESCTESVDLPDWETDAEAEGERLCAGDDEEETEAENEKSGEPLKLGETVPALVREAWAEADSESEIEGHEEGEEELEPDVLVLALALAEWLRDEHDDADGDCVLLSEVE